MPFYRLKEKDLRPDDDFDPEDVPRAIAEIIAMAPGTRPLRQPVHGA